MDHSGEDIFPDQYALLVCESRTATTAILVERNMAPNVEVERHAVAPTEPKLLDPDSSIPSDDQRRRRRVSAATRVGHPLDHTVLDVYLGLSVGLITDNLAPGR